MMEELWVSLIGPLINWRTQLHPIGMIPGADYSYLERFDAAPIEGDPIPGRYYTDIKKLLREDFAFVPSERDLGVQIVDLVASILTRALNGTLQRQGWEDLGGLFLHRPQRTIRLIALSGDAHGPESREVTDPHWITTINELESRARPMLTRQTVKQSGWGGQA